MLVKTIIKTLPIQSIQTLLKTQPNDDKVVDGLRGLSVIMVVIFHAMFVVYFLFKSRPELFQSYVEQFGLPLRFIFGFDKAVDLFFMISAYLLGKSLFKQARGEGVQTRRFYINRLFRIYPLFLLALILYSLGSWHLFERDFWFNLIFIDNFMGNTIIPVGWSLSVEMQCYLVLPLVVWLAEKSNHPVKFMLALLMFSIGLRAWMALAIPEVYQTPFHAIFMNPSIDYQYMDQMYYATPSRLSSFIVGLLWAVVVLHRNFAQVVGKVNDVFWIRTAIIAFSAIAVFISFYFPIYDASLWLEWPILEPLNLYLVVMHRVVFAIALLVLILFLRQPSSYFARFLSWPIFRIFSKLAFPVYLFHFPALAIAWLMILQTTNLKSIVSVTPSQTALAAVFALIIVVWVSLPLHFLIERKGVLMGRRLNDKLNSNKKV